MNSKPRYRLTSDSGEYIVGALVLCALVIGLLHDHLLLAMVAPLVVLGGLVLYLMRQKNLQLFEEGFALRDGRKKSEAPLLPYGSMEQVEFQPSVGRGMNRLRVVFRDEKNKLRTLEFYFKAWVPRRELEFLKEKGVVVKSPAGS